jgi:hypothetical protein
MNDSHLFLFQTRTGFAHGETLASALAARGDHFATAFGLHPLQETVCTGAFFSFGLIYSLDHDHSLIER